jgi:hypothetical protein
MAGKLIRTFFSPLTQILYISDTSTDDKYNAMEGVIQKNQYDIGRRGCAFMSSLPKANWNGQTGGRAQVSIGMHAHPKITRLE